MLRIGEAHKTYQTLEATGRDTAHKKREAQVRPHAKVTTKSIGLSLGMFGVQYESRDVQLDPSLSKDRREEQYRERAFRAERHVSDIRSAMVAQAVYEHDDEGTTGSGKDKPSTLRRRIGAAAYAAANRSPYEDVRPGMMVTAAV